MKGEKDIRMIFLHGTNQRYAWQRQAIVYYYTQWVWICTMGLNFVFLSLHCTPFRPVSFGIQSLSSSAYSCRISQADVPRKVLLEACQSRKLFWWEMMVLFLDRDLVLGSQCLPLFICLSGFRYKRETSLKVYPEKNRRDRIEEGMKKNRNSDPLCKFIPVGRNSTKKEHKRASKCTTWILEARDKAHPRNRGPEEYDQSTAS